MSISHIHVLLLSSAISLSGLQSWCLSPEPRTSKQAKSRVPQQPSATELNARENKTFIPKIYETFELLLW